MQIQISWLLHVDPDQLASEEDEANWSRSSLFVIEYVNFYKKKKKTWIK